MNKTGSITFRIDAKLHKAAEIVARASGRSLSNFIVRALETAVYAEISETGRALRIAQQRNAFRDIQRIMMERK